MALLCLIGAAARAGDMCPTPPAHSPGYEAGTLNDHLIHIESDNADLDARENARLDGGVTVRQDERRVAADTVSYDHTSGRIDVRGSVEFEDTKVRIKGDTGTYETTGDASFGDADFRLLDRKGRGHAAEIGVKRQGRISLDLVRYTTCPVGSNDWMLQASRITLDTVREVGTGRGVWLQVRGVPVVYLPYISFPLGDQRKSGFLFPTIGHSRSNGVQLATPYYFNLAPNYDLTLTPELLSARGVELGGQLRFLTAASRGEFDGVFLPDDSITHDNRAYLHFRDITDLSRHMRLDTDLTSVSDSTYFENFAVGSEETSVTFLERRLDLFYADDVWRIRAQLQNFQTIDVSGVPSAVLYNGMLTSQRPYSSLPEIDAHALFPLWDSPLEVAVDTQVVNFLRDIGPNGLRVDLSPELRWSQRAAGYFFVPAVGWHFTQYDLNGVAAGLPDAPTREVPYGRLDTGLVFERDAGSRGQRSETLEPRLVYSFVPYRNQDELPIFDTALPDPNLTELFRTNRFVGGDRIGDANQLSFGLTTRLFDQVTGLQYISATLGQTHYFSEPRVGLPCIPLSQTALGAGALPGTPAYLGSTALPGAVAQSADVQCVSLPGQAPTDFRGSDIIGQVALTAFKNWTVNLDYQWNPYTSITDKYEVGVLYKPEAARLVNVSYRYQRGILDQWDGSFEWPIAGHWNTVGRYVYSIRDRQPIEEVAGIEYKSCCWAVQLVQRRFVSTFAQPDGQPGALNSSVALQFELTGLSAVQRSAQSYLERAIRGYELGAPLAP
jgi:LPS-assembly protein